MAVVAYNSGLDIERMFAVAQNLTFDTNNEGNFFNQPLWTQKCSRTVRLTVRTENFGQ